MKGMKKLRLLVQQLKQADMAGTAMASLAISASYFYLFILAPLGLGVRPFLFF